MKLMLNGKEVSGMGHYVMAGDIKDATAEDSNVLSGKSYYNNNGKREGTMPNRGGMGVELAAGGSVSIPEGYHNGEGVVRAQELASQTQGDAGAGDIASGKTAWVNGKKVEGTAEMGFAPLSLLSETKYGSRHSQSPAVHTVQNANTKLLGVDTKKVQTGYVSFGLLLDMKGTKIVNTSSYTNSMTVSVSGKTFTITPPSGYSITDLYITEITY